MRLLFVCIIFSVVACSDHKNEVNLEHIGTTPNGHLDIALGDSIQLAGTYYDKSGLAESSTLVWTSGNNNVVLIKSGGKAVAKSIGNTTVTASFHGAKSEPIDITVFNDENKVISVEISVLMTTVSVGEEVTFSFIARNSDGDVIPGKVASWQSDEIDVLTIGASTGIAVGQSPGPALITARVEGVTSNAIEITVVQ